MAKEKSFKQLKAEQRREKEAESNRRALDAYTREQRRAYQRNWRLAHPHYCRDWSREHPLTKEQRLAKKVFMKEYNAEYYQRPEVRSNYLLKEKIYRESNKEQIALSKKLWCEKHKEERKLASKLYYETHKNDPIFKEKRKRRNAIDNAKRSNNRLLQSHSYYWSN